MRSFTSAEGSGGAGGGAASCWRRNLFITLTATNMAKATMTKSKTVWMNAP